MYVLFFLVWVIFNGQLTMEIALFGVGVSAAVYWFACKFMDWSPQKDWLYLKRSGLFLRYLGLLIVEIVKANVAVLRLTLNPTTVPKPVLVQFKTKLKSRTAKVLLANSITLTPGTITVALKEDELLVHCLDRTLSEGLEDSSFEQALLKMEERKERK